MTSPTVEKLELLNRISSAEEELRLLNESYEEDLQRIEINETEDDLIYEWSDDSPPENYYSENKLFYDQKREELKQNYEIEKERLREKIYGREAILRLYELNQEKQKQQKNKNKHLRRITLLNNIKIY
jgi:hypothetical protein